MKIFIDTSSLFKLYHVEEGSNHLLSLFKNNEIDVVYLSEITKIEFDSVVWKKYRKGELDVIRVSKTIHNFEKDFPKFSFVKDSLAIKKTAKNFNFKIWKRRVTNARFHTVGISTSCKIRK